MYAEGVAAPYEPTQQSGGGGCHHPPQHSQKLASMDFTDRVHESPASNFQVTI